MNKKILKEQIKDLAWIGDAVLALYVREWLLKQTKDPDFTRQELFTRFTSNSFLNAFAEPTEVEAKIGKIYKAAGLDEAFDHIETTFLPVFQKQLSNARKRKRALS